MALVGAFRACALVKNNKEASHASLCEPAAQLVARQTIPVRRPVSLQGSRADIYQVQILQDKTPTPRSSAQRIESWRTRRSRRNTTSGNLRSAQNNSTRKAWATWHRQRTFDAAELACIAAVAKYAQERWPAAPFFALHREVPTNTSQ